MRARKRRASLSSRGVLLFATRGTIFSTVLAVFLLTALLLVGAGIGGSSSYSLSECQSLSSHGSPLLLFCITRELVREGPARALVVLLPPPVPDLGNGKMHCRCPFKTSRYLSPSCTSASTSAVAEKTAVYCTHRHIGVREAHIVLFVPLPQNVLDEQVLKQPFMIASIPA